MSARGNSHTRYLTSRTLNNQREVPEVKSLLQPEMPQSGRMQKAEQFLF